MIQKSEDLPGLFYYPSWPKRMVKILDKKKGYSGLIEKSVRSFFFLKIRVTA